MKHLKYMFLVSVICYCSCTLLDVYESFMPEWFWREKVIFLLFMYNLTSIGIENNESGIMICLIADKTDSGVVSV